MSDSCIIMLLFYTDVDECQEQPTVCGSNAVCNNQPGTFRCECLEGYQFSDDGRTCIGEFISSPPLLFWEIQSSSREYYK